MKRLFIILFFFSSLTLLHAQNGQIKIQPKNSVTPQVEPRNTLSLVLEISNVSGSKLHLKTQLRLPDGWRQLFECPPLSLAPGQMKTQLVNLFIPEQTLAGKHTAELEIINESNGKILASQRYDIEVLPLVNIEVSVNKAPPYVIDGEDISAVFMYYNRSNTAVDLVAEVKSSSQFGHVLGGEMVKKIHLQSGERKEIPVTLKTPGYLQDTSELFLRLENRLSSVFPENAVFKVRFPLKTSMRLTIFPAVSRNKPEYHTFPAQITLSHSEQFWSEWESENFVEFKGEGYLDENHEHHLSFLLRKDLSIPDMPLYSANDHYSMAYDYKSFSLLAGHNSYSVSPLLAENINSIGAKADLGLNNFCISSWILEYPAYDKSETGYGLGFGYSVPNSLYPENYKYRAKMNVYEKHQESMTVGVLQQFRPTPASDLLLEVAAGTSDQDDWFSDPVFSAIMKSTWKPENADLRLDISWAEPGFTGWFNDRFKIDSQASVSLFNKKLRLLGGFTWTVENLDLDETIEDTYSIIRGMFGIRLYWLKPRGDIFLRCIVENKADRINLSETDTLQTKLNLSVNQRFDRLKINAGGEFQIDFDRNSDEYEFRQSYSAGGTYAMNSSINGIMEIGFQENDGEDIKYDRFDFTTGVEGERGRWKWSAGITNRYTFNDWEFSYMDLTLSGSSAWTFRGNHKIESQFQLYIPLDKADDTPEVSLSLEYSMPVEVPIAKKKNVGSLSGFILNQVDNTPIEGTIVRAAGKTVITDKKGSFVLNSLPAGEYFLELKTADLKEHMIPDLPQPILFNIENGKITKLEIEMVQSASVSGQILIYGYPEIRSGVMKTDENTDVADEYIETGTMNGMLVELKNGDEVRRMYTNNQGKFEFKDIRPGTWTLSANPAVLTDRQYLEQPSVKVQLLQGAQKQIILRVLPKKTEIKEMRQGGTLQLENP
ncbi:MAG: hypothetical protein JW874_10040 [Spirochaetales bacterium]|nr:hypothetical protein [Spirochaetales bacterium]